MTYRYRTMIMSLTAILVVAMCVPAFAIDAPQLSATMSGHGKQTIIVTAGATGLPDGFEVWWMDATEYASRGGVWPSTQEPGISAAKFTGTPTLNTFDGTYTTFQLGANENVKVEIGDLMTETGVTGSADELDYGKTYYYVAFALDGAGLSASALSATVSATTTNSTNCTYTIGWWKTHPDDWMVISLDLGTVSYTQAELLDILNESVKGNGLVSLAHQLIAAKLNIIYGADPTAASAAIAAADALIGGLVVPPVGGGYLDPSDTSALTQTLDDYNNGVIGPGHCGTVPAVEKTWGSIKATYR